MGKSSKHGAPNGVGSIPGGLAGLMQMAQSGGMGPMGGMPMEQGGMARSGGMFGGMRPQKTMYDSVEAQNAASARDRMMRGQVGFEGPDWAARSSGMAFGGPDSQGNMPPQMYGQRGFQTPYGGGGMGMGMPKQPMGMGSMFGGGGGGGGMFGGAMGGGGGMNPMQYAMQMYQQRMGGGRPGMPNANGSFVSNPGLQQQAQTQRDKVAAEQAAIAAKQQADVKKKQQDKTLAQWKNQNPLLRANQSYDDYMMQQQFGSGGGA